MSTKPQIIRTEQGASAENQFSDAPSDFQGANYVAERSQRGLPSTKARRLAKGLGWFSVGLGLTELLAPNVIVKISGVPNKNRGLIRLYGLRELASGIGIFSQQNPAPAVWSRVAGDVIDLASLGSAFTSPNAKRGRLAFATANVLAVTALDVMCAKQLSNGKQGVHAKGICVVNRSPEEVYNFWRNFQNLPRFMRHLESVSDLGNGRSHWVAKGPAGIKVEWDAAMVADVPGEVITWHSLENSDVDNAGAVRFERAPGNRGTIVKVNIQYNPPAGVVGATVAKLLGEAPEQQLEEDLLRFKQVMEVGEVIVSDATLFGTGYMEQRPARPAAPSELQQADVPVRATGSDYKSREGRAAQK